MPVSTLSNFVVARPGPSRSVVVKLVVLLPGALLACGLVAARAGEPLQTAAQPARAAGEPALPVAPYAGTPTGEASVAHWNVLVQDITLARTLERWGAQAGVRVKWDAQRNFLIGAPDSMEGTFETALKAILSSSGIRQSDYPLEACIYANSPPLVRITRQGEQARECEAP
jgi:hypothetical protein